MELSQPNHVLPQLRANYLVPRVIEVLQISHHFFLKESARTIMYARVALTGNRAPSLATSLWVPDGVLASPLPFVMANVHDMTDVGRYALGVLVAQNSARVENYRDPILFDHRKVSIEAIRIHFLGDRA